MQQKKVWLITVLMLASAVIGAMAASSVSLISQVQAQRTGNTARTTARRFDYQTYIAASPKDLADQANKLGEEGWELVDVVTDERLVTRYIGFFARERR